MGGGVEVGRWVRVPTDTERERGLSEGERYKETDRERERGPCLPGHSGNLSRHPARKSGQDNISKLRRTQT